MTAFVDPYDVAFFDLDGVIYLGPAAVDGAPEGVRALRERGVRPIYVTNNAARSAEAVAEHLTELGVRATADDLVTSAQAAAVLLARELPAGARVLVAGSANLANLIAGAGFETVTSADDQPDAVIQGYDPTMTWPRLDEAALAVQRGARWFATNADSTRPSDRGLLPGAGTMVQAVRATVTIDPTIIGKPHRPLLDEALRRTGARHPVFVGDRIDTDIMGANGVGIDSFMVFTGAHGRWDLCEAPPLGRPTAIGWNIESMLEPRRVATVEDGSARCGSVTVRAVAGAAVLDGDVSDREAQLDALWATAQLAWREEVSRYDAVLTQLDLLP